MDPETRVDAAICVKDAMTANVITARPDTSIAEIGRLVLDHGINAVPVVADDDVPSFLMGSRETSACSWPGAQSSSGAARDQSSVLPAHRNQPATEFAGFILLSSRLLNTPRLDTDEHRCRARRVDVFQRSQRGFAQRRLCPRDPP